MTTLPRAKWNRDPSLKPLSRPPEDFVSVCVCVRANEPLERQPASQPVEDDDDEDDDRKSSASTDTDKLGGWLTARGRA